MIILYLRSSRGSSRGGVLMLSPGWNDASMFVCKGGRIDVLIIFLDARR
jgi:hypothetical protein